MLKRIRSNKKLRYAVYVILIWVAIHITYITIDGLRDYDGSADVAVVLGNTVYGPGNLSPWMKGRADAAVKLYMEKRVKKIFASGGISTPEDGSYPEGTAIKEYLVKQGVPDNDVIADNAGKNTFLTARDYQEWNKTNQCNSVIVVTQFYHITRTKYIFRKLGIKNVHNVSSDYFNWRDIIGALREVPAFYKYLLFY